MLEEILTKLRGEEIRLDAGLYLCKKLEDDLEDCLNIVERLNRKYNTDTAGGPGNSSASGASDLGGDCLLSQQNQNQDKDLEQGQDKQPDQDMDKNLDQDQEDWDQQPAVKVLKARSGQQLSSSYGDMHTECMKLKRELDDTMSLAKQINELAHRQRNNYCDIPENVWRI